MFPHELCLWSYEEIKNVSQVINFICHFFLNFQTYILVPLFNYKILYITIQQILTFSILYLKKKTVILHKQKIFSLALVVLHPISFLPSHWFEEFRSSLKVAECVSFCTTCAFKTLAFLKGAWFIHETNMVDHVPFL